MHYRRPFLGFSLHTAGAKGAPLECFTAVNTTGDRYGNCSNAENKTKCESNIVKCGLAQCVNVKNISLSDNRTSIVQTPMGKSWCWSLDYKLNMDIPHVGRVPDGAKCDIGKICLSGKCVPDSALKYDCDAKNKCSGRGDQILPPDEAKVKHNLVWGRILQSFIWKVDFGEHFVEDFS
uniref:Disintegrin and metalloproteinase domain-containing protein 9-like isoform X2 n=1 Tax=Geotrypetes seraphini TaxID=260995 RepID=A0A6P8R6N3_GEOSA|nr:disintegrin and metalloproteinase domain-containing protein 9-like isoform X2 [Geotrypetes seraphini]